MNTKTLIPKGLDDIEKLRRLFSVSDNLCNALAIIVEDYNYNNLTADVSIGCKAIENCEE